MNDKWDAKRIRLEHLVLEAAMDLFEHMGNNAGAFRLKLDNTTPTVYVIAGDARAVKDLAEQEWQDRLSGKKGT